MVCHFIAFACPQWGAQLLETWRVRRGKVRSSKTDMRFCSGSSGETYTARRCRRGNSTCRISRFSLPTKQLSTQMLTLCTTCSQQGVLVHQELPAKDVFSYFLCVEQAMLGLGTRCPRKAWSMDIQVQKMLKQIAKMGPVSFDSKLHAGYSTRQSSYCQEGLLHLTVSRQPQQLPGIMKVQPHFILPYAPCCQKVPQECTGLSASHLGWSISLYAGHQPNRSERPPSKTPNNSCNCSHPEYRRQTCLTWHQSL